MYYCLCIKTKYMSTVLNMNIHFFNRIKYTHTHTQTCAHLYICTVILFIPRLKNNSPQGRLATRMRAF